MWVGLVPVGASPFVGSRVRGKDGVRTSVESI